MYHRGVFPGAPSSSLALGTPPAVPEESKPPRHTHTRQVLVPTAKRHQQRGRMEEGLPAACGTKPRPSPSPGSPAAFLNGPAPLAAYPRGQEALTHPFTHWGAEVHKDGAEAHLQVLFGGWRLQGGSVVGSMGSLEPGHCLLINNTALSGPSWVTRKGSGLRRQLVLNPLARHAGLGLRKVS